MFIKKGAMFGLDARIALAIFGALSVISGAALYSAIQQAKMTSVVTELKEMVKAIEAYLLDTGSDIRVVATDTAGSALWFSDLSTNGNSASGYQGPYLSYEQVASPAEYHYIHPLHSQLHLGKGQDIAFDNLVADSATCTAGKLCYYWVQTQNTPCQIAYTVDEYVDGSADYENGNVRILVRPGGTLCKIYLKGPAMLSQP
ncbi:MAG: hypothetical protein CFH44_00120 [Proteobacteria bacterium]|nr:MAG: hypothetical protein CFH44_00120 [Pseudomonadota bacterium]